MNLQGWLDSGNWIDIKGRRLFYHDTGGEKPVLCILHGFPTSSYDYHRALHLLSRHFRVIVHDHLGFGASDKPLDYSYSLVEQTDYAIEFWQKLGIDQTFVFAHDYGASIATELMYRANRDWLPVHIQGFVFSNGGVHIELARLKWMQKLLRLPFIGSLIAHFSNEQVFRNNILATCYSDKVISNDELSIHWQLLIREEGKRVIPVISRYTNERVLFWHRWIGAIQQYQQGIDLIWGENDPVAILDIAETIRKESQRSTLNTLSECGHFPMIEKTEEWVERVVQAINIRQQLL